MAATPLIEVRNLRRTYHVGDVDIEALRGVDLSIAHGEFIAIVGASGSGKSTLMAILGCLDKPTSGGYWLEGVDVARLDEPSLARIRSERIGFVFQNFNLLGRTTALENVVLPLFYSSADTGSAERIARAREALERVGLGQRTGNTPAQLSGGQQQRVAIARALINAPRVLLADEPTGNLDTKTSVEIMNTLTALNRRDGVTVVLVTHEPDIAAYADRVVTMRDGEVVSDESTRPHPPILTAAATVEAPATPRGANATRFAMMVASAAVQAIGRNKLRSALTMLGIFIGVAALITMVAVGEGANEAVKKQLQSLGTNLLVVQPGATTTTGVRAGFGSASSLTVDDAEALKRDDPAVAAISYVNRQTGQVQYADKNWTTNIQGVSPDYARMTNWDVALGRGLTAQDENSTALVVILGQTVYRELFGVDQNPLGATILVKGTPLRVTGLLAAKGQTPWGQDQDDLVLIPFSTAEEKVLGVAAPPAAPAASTSIYASTANPNYETSPNPFGLSPRITGFARLIYVQAANDQAVDAALTQVTDTLDRRHRIKTGDTPDFSVRNLSQIASAAEGSSRIMTLLLAAVASISLLVGGIGIMNILLVSVTERTREIGLRMAIGARRTDVLMQFLAEAIFLSVTGGLAGIIVGVAMSKIVSAIAGWPTVVSPLSIAGAFVFSAAVGIFFGYYPARKGSQLDPIEALRYE
ncbi:MAG TPA: ABC transporter permease [Vicinamibacterales bacterium]|nr:ABC transporter permease [Vicinamibacterales bacterium]